MENLIEHAILKFGVKYKNEICLTIAENGLRIMGINYSYYPYYIRVVTPKGFEVMQYTEENISVGGLFCILRLTPEFVQEMEGFIEKDLENRFIWGV